MTRFCPPSCFCQEAHQACWDIPCPVCKAPEGQPCEGTGGGRSMRYSHAARRRARQAAARKTPEHPYRKENP